MKYKLMILFFLISLIIGLSSNIFTVDKVIYTEDNRLSLKDFFKDIPFDRTITYLSSDSNFYNKEDIEKMIKPFLSIYYENYQIIFNSNKIKIEIKKSNIKDNYFDFTNFLSYFLKNNYPEIKVKKIVQVPKEVDVKNIKVVNYFINSDNLYMSIKYQSGDIMKFSTINAKVEKFSKILLTKTSLNAGDKLTVDNTYEATKNILEFNFETISLNEIEFGKYKISKNYEANEPINKNYLKIIPDILKGDIVNIFVIYKGITIQTTGKALKDSNYGQTISVKNIDTNEIITGILKEGPSVYVYLGGDKN